MAQFQKYKDCDPEVMDKLREETKTAINGTNR